MSTEPIRLRQLLERLRAAEIDFVLVGGLAVNAWGYLRATRDVDLVPDPSSENLAKLAASDIPSLSASSFSVGQVPTFAALDERATEVDIDGLKVKVCSLDDLLAMKRASERPRDRDDLEALEAAHRDRR